MSKKTKNKKQKKVNFLDLDVGVIFENPSRLFVSFSPFVFYFDISKFCLLYNNLYSEHKPSTMFSILNYI